MTHEAIWIPKQSAFYGYDVDNNPNKLIRKGSQTKWQKALSILFNFHKDILYVLYNLYVSFEMLKTIIVLSV